MKLLRRGECLLPPRRGNVNNRLRPEKVQSSCFRTGVRFPSAPPNKTAIPSGWQFYSVSKKSDHDRYRSASYGWTTLSARQSAADFAKSCGTYACTARFGVGVDAYIDPADCTVFTVICGEFATSRRADVGIGPYRVLREFTAAHRADRGVRPYASLGNPTQNRKTIVF